VDPTLPDLFRAMGLKPLDEFIAGMDASARRKGATTWMALSAAKCLKDGTDACLICHNQQYADEVAQQVIEFCRRMSLGSTKQAASGWAKFHNGTTLRWKAGDSSVVRVVDFSGTIFNDEVWADRTDRRIEGPYAMIRAIRLENGEYIGCAEDEEPVMDFTKAGALDFLADNPEVLPIGFDRPRLRRNKVHPL